MKSIPHIITLSSDIAQLVETALDITGKVEFTQENPTMEIPIKGKIILKFGSNEVNNRIIELEIRK